MISHFFYPLQSVTETLQRNNRHLSRAGSATSNFLVWWCASRRRFPLESSCR